MDLFEKYPGLVSHDQTWNALTEFYAPSGKELENGMVVLIEPARYRWDIRQVTEFDSVQLKKALAANRWCQVSALEVNDAYVSFLGTYEDRGREWREYPVSCGWLVKRNSVTSSGTGSEGGGGKMMQIHGEEIIRRIVREEIQKFAESVAKTSYGLADGLDSYETGDLERAGHRAIKKVMELEESMLPHAWNCNLRDPEGYDDKGNELKCSCGVGDED